jgi:hypothetical protein
MLSDALIVNDEDTKGSSVFTVGASPEDSNLIRDFSSRDELKPPSPACSPSIEPPMHQEGDAPRARCEDERSARSLKRKPIKPSQDAVRAPVTAPHRKVKAHNRTNSSKDSESNHSTIALKSNAKRGIPVSGRTYNSKKANAVIEEALSRARVILDRQEARAMMHERGNLADSAIALGQGENVDFVPSQSEELIEEPNLSLQYLDKMEEFHAADYGIPVCLM